MAEPIKVGGMKMRHLFIASLFVSTVLSGVAGAQDPRKVGLGPNADLGGTRLLPADSPWHRDISKDPVDSRSSRILTRLGLNTGFHPDFGAEWEGVPMAIPNVVAARV